MYKEGVDDDDDFVDEPPKLKNIGMLKLILEIIYEQEYMYVTEYWIIILNW